MLLAVPGRGVVGGAGVWRRVCPLDGGDVLELHGRAYRPSRIVCSSRSHHPVTWWAVVDPSGAVVGAANLDGGIVRGGIESLSATLAELQRARGPRSEEHSILAAA